LKKLIDTVSGILNTEVVFSQTCIRCGKDFPCTDCKYNELCTTKDLPFSCVCPKCLTDRKQFEEYLEKILGAALKKIRKLKKIKKGK